MIMFRTLVWAAARHAASNPHLRRAAMDAARKAAPVMRRAAQEARVAARDLPPLKDPRGFAREVARRMRTLR